MKYIHNKLIHCLCAMVFFAFSAQAQAETLRVAVEGAYPPFSMVERGQLTGFDIDFAKSLCAKMGVECELIKRDWSGIIPGLVQDKYDMIIASMSITDERKKSVDFSDPYYFTVYQFIGPKSGISEASASAMKGKKVGVQLGSVSDDFITKKFPQATAVRYGTTEEMMADLGLKRIDFAFNDSVVFLGEGEDILKKYKLLSPEYSDTDIFGEGIGIALQKNQPKLKAKINSAIKQVVQSGDFKAIQAKYFSINLRPDL